MRDSVTMGEAMKKNLQKMASWAQTMARKPKVRKVLALGAAAIVVLRSYFVQEVLAAEAFFAAAFAIVAATVGVIYLAGSTVAGWLEDPGQKVGRDQALVNEGGMK